MPESTPAEAVQKQQQKDAARLLQRLEQVSVPDLTVSYTLEKSATVRPGRRDPVRRRWPRSASERIDFVLGQVDLFEELERR